MRSLGQVHGYYDSSDWKTAVFVDMIVESHSDVFNAAMKAALFTPGDQKVQAMHSVRDGICKKFFAMCEKHLEMHNSPKFIAGNSITIADFCLASFIFNHVKNDLSPLHDILMPLLHDLPHFSAYIERLAEEQHDHLEKRPKNMF